MAENQPRADDPFSVPEVTRGLRSFASPAALGGAHDRFFAPLLDARRAAKLATRWSSRMTAFDAERLEATLRVTLQTFAADEHPNNAPERRGLSAQLEDACGELFDALTDLGEMAASVQGAPDEDVRLERWRAWVRALRRVFAAADRGWEHASHLLSPAAGSGGSRRPSRASRPSRRR